MSAGRAAVLAILSAAACALSFPPVSFWPLAFVALAPFFLVVRDTSVRRAITVSLAFWWGYFFLGLLWVTSVTTIGLVVLTLVLSVFGLACGLSLRLASRSRFVPYWLAAPAIFTAIEYARTLLLTGFPWILLGHSQQRFLAFAQIADVGGVYGITFLLALVGAAVAEIVRERAVRSFLPIGIAATLVVFAVGYGVLRLNTIELRPGPVVTGIQANLSPYDKHGENRAEENLASHLRLTDEAMLAHPETDLVTWSETMYPVPLDENDERRYRGHLEILGGLAETRWKRPLLVGAVRVATGATDKRSFDRREYNSAFLFSAKGELTGRYDKMHLVPAGEFIPLRRWLPFRETIENVLEDMLLYFPNLTPGADAVVLPLSTPHGDYRFGTLICFDSIFPEPGREMVQRGAQFLVNLSNDGWYGESAELDQMIEMSAFRAIENRVPLFRATNTGITASIDPLGRVVEQVEVAGDRKQVRGTLTSRLSMTDARSPYTRIGDVVAQALVLLSLAALVDGWRGHRS